jgi:exodeoxyribonuclease VII large subunit
VWHDIQRVIERRYPLVELVLAPTIVQGDQAPKSIVAAIERLLELPDVDLIIVGRGGGSVEDLWCFNDERVVRSIFSSRLPIVSAVGHETDFTLSDYVADLRAPTPSAAAELVVPDIEQLFREVQGWQLTARSWFLAGLQERLADVHFLLQRLQLVSPMHQLLTREATVERLANEAQRIIERKLVGSESRLAHSSVLLAALDPIAMLRRGYAQLTRINDGSLVGRAGQLSQNDSVRATFADGYAELTATSIMNTQAASPSTSSKRGQS